MSNAFIHLMFSQSIIPLVVIFANMILCTNITLVSHIVILSINCIHSWIRDSIREFTASYVSVIGILTLAFWLLVGTESLFFVTLFWLVFHLSCSTLSCSEFLYIPSYYTISFTNSIVLSNSGFCLSLAYICSVTIIVSFTWYFLTSILGILFIITQIIEFHNITYYINESIYSSVLYFLTGLHFTHVVVGIIILVFQYSSCTYIRSLLLESLYTLAITTHHIYSSLQTVYWHFVELLWLIIYYILYIY
jgi:cytochrome c oxidase subunit 3